MKKLLFVAGLFIVAGIFSTVSAQNGAAVVEHYNKAIGIGQTDAAKANVMAKMSANNMGMKIPCTIILSNSTHRMRAEMEANGQKMQVVIDGEKGWMSVPGMAIQSLQAEQIEKYQKQFDVFSMLRWDTEGYDFVLLEPRTEDDKKYDVVKAIAQKEDAKKKEQTLYFDNATGLLTFIESPASDGNPPVIGRIMFGDYKTTGKCVYPSEIKMMANGMELGGITIDTLVFDYPVTDEMFAEPK